MELYSEKGSIWNSIFERFPFLLVTILSGSFLGVIIFFVIFYCFHEIKKDSPNENEPFVNKFRDMFWKDNVITDNIPLMDFNLDSNHSPLEQQHSFVEQDLLRNNHLNLKTRIVTTLKQPEIKPIVLYCLIASVTMMV